MDIYVVLDGARVVGASARLQGAELIRADEARRLAAASTIPADEAALQKRMLIVNTELQDME
ncbi:hypothetical protein SEA_JEON_59 [Mycobacterium phage Jeon]|uniref:Uncharacterized protein n=1 Tax=Mycobacterium phage Jeon TaxID=2108123 RepID=A0A2P1JRP2_9CAUD|nr:hypothetical protein PQB70_gp59 [Mycobacterium phage Jeon]AVO21762.1 hypothetical protein SEA_JEON_59 [Mycobacterium phage Jeon]